jgi:hypothetical protein
MSTGMGSKISAIAALPLVLTACLGGGAQMEEPPEPPTYGPVVIAELAENLVQVKLSMTTQTVENHITEMANCNLASYALQVGRRYARHLRTNAYEEDGLWRADAVYSLSDGRPRGQVIDAATLVVACSNNNIPMV